MTVDDAGAYGKIKDGLRARLWPAAITIVIILAGTLLRLRGYQSLLPYALVKYGGSALWGAMVYWMVVTVAPRLRPGRVLWIAVVLAVSSELFRLYHMPWLDDFRLTLAGALLLGRIFSLYNILAYAVGIVLAAVTDRRHHGWARKDQASGP